MFLCESRTCNCIVLLKITKEQACSGNFVWCSVTSVKLSKRNVEKTSPPLLFFLHHADPRSFFKYDNAAGDVCVSSRLLNCFPFCLLFSGVRCRSTALLPNVSQVSLCCSIHVNFFDITLGAVTSTLLPALPGTPIVPAMQHSHKASASFKPHR